MQVISSNEIPYKIFLQSPSKVNNSSINDMNISSDVRKKYSSGSTVKGTIIDKRDKEPLIGATVQPKYQRNGTATDIDGNFTLKDIKIGEVIEVSYVDYKTKIITLKNKVPNNIIVKLRRGKGTDYEEY